MPLQLWLRKCRLTSHRPVAKSADPMILKSCTHTHTHARAADYGGVQKLDTALTDGVDAATGHQLHASRCRLGAQGDMLV